MIRATDGQGAMSVKQEDLSNMGGEARDVRMGTGSNSGNYFFSCRHLKEEEALAKEMGEQNYCSTYYIFII